jgi:hypothetical protein
MEPRAHPPSQPVVWQQPRGQLAHGEGLLYQATLLVNELGKLNVYEYIYFLVQHARRYLTQMQNNEAE